MDIKAIQTHYKGCHFRSRIEARWAVFFEALNLKWEYEKEGFDIGQAGKYLPDFWLPEIRAWFEIKGPDATDDEHRKAGALAKQTKYPVVMLSGNIGYESFVEDYFYEPSYKCDIHFGSPELFIHHCFGEESKDKTNLIVYCFEKNESFVKDSWMEYLGRCGCEFPETNSFEELVLNLCKLHKESHLKLYGEENIRYAHGFRLGSIVISNFIDQDWRAMPPRKNKKLVLKEIQHQKEIDENIIYAFNKGRSARFEFGQSG